MPTYRKNCHGRRAPGLLSAVSTSVLLLAPAAHADQGGVPFWFSGQYASLVAPPPAPGWSLGVVGYNYSGGAEATKTFEIGDQLVAGVNADITAGLIQLGYAPKTKFLDGQFRAALTGGVGYAETSAITLTQLPVAVSRTDSVTGTTDLYPSVSLSWNMGKHNVMLYGTGDIPVGDYNHRRLANLGIGHGAADIGGAYTYLDPTKGRELSAVMGFTFNTENTSVHYINGDDFHLDWAASQFLSKNWQVGVVGYVYDQMTPDGGSGNRVGSFESGVAAIGGEVGYLFAIGQSPAYVNFRGYSEFWSRNRVEGRAFYLTIGLPLGGAPR